MSANLDFLFLFSLCFFILKCEETLPILTLIVNFECLQGFCNGLNSLKNLVSVPSPLSLMFLCQPQEGEGDVQTGTGGDSSQTAGAHRPCDWRDIGGEET